MNNNLNPRVNSEHGIKKRVFLGLGGNLGDVKTHLINAVECLRASGDVEIVCASPVFETPPWGIEDQPVFLNMCIGIKTCLLPIDLLRLCQRVENSLNRERTVRWGPRTIDIDILLMEDTIVDLPDLTIPHARIKERSFVLVPLAEIAPDWMLDGRSIACWRQKCNDGGIRKVAGQELFNDMMVRQDKP